jgi:hypothetical protein
MTRSKEDVSPHFACARAFFSPCFSFFFVVLLSLLFNSISLFTVKATQSLALVPTQILLIIFFPKKTSALFAKCWIKTSFHVLPLLKKKRESQTSFHQNICRFCCGA